jgi:hypothetical protein
MSLMFKALNVAVIDDDYKLIYQASKGIIFIGTPHRGAALATYLSKVLTITFSDKKFVPELAPGSTAITEITHDFTKHTAEMQFVSFYEARGMHIIGVFPSES